jgi:hypothetical protein
VQQGCNRIWLHPYMGEPNGASTLLGETKQGNDYANFYLHEF